VAGSCEHGDESLGSGTTELVSWSEASSLVTIAVVKLKR
jgi:hypothetical protein